MLIDNKIKFLCEKNNITLKELVKKLKITPQGYYGMIRNNTMQIRTLQAIADYFKVPIVSFFIDDKEIFKNDVEHVFNVLKEIVKERIGK